MFAVGGTMESYDLWTRYVTVQSSCLPGRQPESQINVTCPKWGNRLQISYSPKPSSLHYYIQFSHERKIGWLKKNIVHTTAIWAQIDGFRQHLTYWWSPTLWFILKPHSFLCKCPKHMNYFNRLPCTSLLQALEIFWIYTVGLRLLWHSAGGAHTKDIQGTEVVDLLVVEWCVLSSSSDILHHPDPFSSIVSSLRPAGTAEKKKMAQHRIWRVGRKESYLF